MNNSKPKKPIYKRWWFIVICIIILIGIINSITDGSESSSFTDGLSEGMADAASSQQDGNSSSSVSEPSEQENIPQILEDAIEQTVDDLHAEKDRITINDNLGTNDPDDKIVLVYLKGSENLTAELTRGGMLADAVTIFTAMQPWQEVSEICVFISYPLVDTSGNTKEDTVLKVMLTRETLNKTNFEYFDKENLSTIADDYFEHAALKN